jgi:hypothetical protein
MNSARSTKKQESLTKSERYAILALRKESIDDLSRALGESAKRVGDTLSEIRKNFRIRHKIAEHLGLSYEQCWGDTEPYENRRRPPLHLAPEQPTTDT